MAEIDDEIDLERDIKKLLIENEEADKRVIQFLAITILFIAMGMILVSCSCLDWRYCPTVWPDTNRTV